MCVNGLTASSEAVLMAYCIEMGAYLELAAMPRITRAKNGADTLSPESRAASTALAAAVRLAGELGITPVGRIRATGSALVPEEQQDWRAQLVS